MKNGFDKLAAPYRWMEYFSFGRALERARFHFLPQLTGTRTALLLGDGDGRFTAALLRTAPAAQAVSIDASKAMLQTSRSRCGRSGTSGRLETIQADLRQGLPGKLLLRTRQKQGSFDLVATHFLIDCLCDAEVDRLAAHVTAQSSPGAQWIISEFRIPPTGRMRLPSRMIVRGLYTAFRLLTGLSTKQLPAYENILQQHGWSMAEQHLHLGGLLTSERWQRTFDSGATPPTDSQA